MAAGVLTMALILYAARGALLPIVANVIVAELLFPIVAFVERRFPGRTRYPRASRIFTIAVIDVAFFTLAGALLYLTIEPVYREASHFVETAPQIYEQAKTTVEERSDEYTRQVPEDVKAQLDGWLRSVGGAIGDATLGVLTQTLTHVSGTVSVIISLVIVPFLLFYILKDKEDLIRGMYSAPPSDVARHTHSLFDLIHEVIGSYGQAPFPLESYRRKS